MQHNALDRQSWSNRFAFYLVAVGSACGLGNLWRFPYVVAENGGGAFVLMYVLLAFCLGLPLLVGELVIGKATRKSVIPALASLGAQNRKPFVWIGRLAVVLTLVVISYYAVISGWVLHFLTQFFIDTVSPPESARPVQLDLLLTSGWLQMGLASVHLLFTVLVVTRGLQQGLEKIIGAVMSVFVVLLLILIFQSLSLPSAADALRFIFYPDFAKLNLGSLGQAIGHVCFTLSVGFGTMVTFGSYFREDEHIPTSGFRVVSVDTFLSFFAALLVFPIALQVSSVPLTDPGLLFEALPPFLVEMRGGSFFGLLFFLCLYLAALGASIGLIEVIVSNLVDRYRWPRRRAAWVAGLGSWAFAVFPALSSSAFSGVKYFNRSLLEILDALLINWILPLIALGLCLVISYGIPTTLKEKHFVDKDKVESVVLFPYWLFFVRWVIPIVIVLGLFLQGWSLFQLKS